MDKPPHAAGRRRDGLVNLGQPTNPQNSAYVLFAVLPPKNSDSTGAEVFLHKVLRLPKIRRGLRVLSNLHGYGKKSETDRQDFFT